MEKITFDLPDWTSYDELIVQKLKHGQKIQIDMVDFESGFRTSSERRMTLTSIENSC